jgi:hypothetical protein
MDLGSYAGRQWLIIIDQFSGWPIVRNLGKDAPTSKITDDLLKMFEQFGLPEQIFSDGGPQFESEEFAKFCAEWRINNETSSPHHHESNGIAENGVKAMKKLIHCCYDPIKGCVNRDEWVKALALYKNTPRGASGLSPAEILFGKMLRDGIPTTRHAYEAKHKEAVQRRLDEVHRHLRQASERCLNRKSQANRMKVGDCVFIQDPATKRWTRTGTIERKGKNEREFFVRTDRGGLWRRNRRFLKLQNPTQTPPAPTAETAPETTTEPVPSAPNRPRGRPPGSKNRVTFEEPVRKSERMRRAPQKFGK